MNANLSRSSISIYFPPLGSKATLKKKNNLHHLFIEEKQS